MDYFGDFHGTVKEKVDLNGRIRGFGINGG